MKVEISPEFKHQANKTLYSIVGFGLIYLLLILFTIGLCAAIIYVAYVLILKFPHFILLFLAISLIVSSLFVFVFLIKFIFSFEGMNTSHLLEVDQDTEPKLFALIEEIVEQVETQLPKKVYLSSEVNASVFYNSSFWSMFFPVRKNLIVGMGLINSVTYQELKGVLAHEFGHFSQRSMRVGSYVYHANHAIYNMLYNNESLNRLSEKWYNTSYYAAAFQWLPKTIIGVMQKILQKQYEVINKNYMALSREMEFHADAISAQVAGSNAVETSLLRSNFSNYCLNNVFNFYGAQMQKNRISADIYADQRAATHYLSNKFAYPEVNGIPQISMAEFNKFDKSKLVITNQWASHPAETDRIAAVDKLNIKLSNTIDEPALQILQNQSRSSEWFTRMIFSQGNYTEEPSRMASEEFAKEFKAWFDSESFDAIFNDYYTFNNPFFKADELSLENGEQQNIETLFGPARVNDTFLLNSYLTDIETLRQIENKTIDIETFDYDGIKYKRTETSEVIEKLQGESAELKEIIEGYNRDVFDYFYYCVQEQPLASKLQDAYGNFMSAEQSYSGQMDLYFDLVQKTNFFYQNHSHSEIAYHTVEVKKAELAFKEELKNLIAIHKANSNTLDTEVEGKLNRFISNTFDYFDGAAYINENLELLGLGLDQYYYLLNDNYFQLKKRILDIQKEIMLQSTVETN